MVVTLVILAVSLIYVLVSDLASIIVVGKPVDHKKWEQILQKHFDEGNYEYSYGFLNTSTAYYHKIFNKERKDIPYVSFSVSGVFIGGYIQDTGSIYRFSKLYRMIKAEMKKQKLAKYEL